MQIRKAVPQDNAAARELVRRSLSVFGIEADFDNIDRAVGLLGTSEITNSIELVAILDGSLVGCLVIQRLTDTCAKLLGFHVATNRQGHGIGRSLLSVAIAEATGLGFTQLNLDTWGNMEAAVHLYESFGWKRDRDPPPESGADRSYSLLMN
jgi:ribosomal protein S18 acetylase RimI-like enzyme